MKVRGTGKGRSKRAGAQPILHQRAPVLQSLGTLVTYPIGLGERTRLASVRALAKILADTASLRDLYKKAHWQVTGPTFFMLHELFERHFVRQNELADLVGERIQTLGGLALAQPVRSPGLAHIRQAPRGREQVPVMISRIIDAHTHILEEARRATRIAEQSGDHGTVNLLTSFVIPDNEKQVWFLATHLAPVRLVRARGETTQRAGRRASAEEAGEGLSAQRGAARRRARRTLARKAAKRRADVD